MRKLGCAVTTLAMALITTISGLAFDPGTLNSFMAGQVLGFDNIYFDPDHNVKFEETTRALLPGKRFVAEDSTNTKVLDAALCAGFPEVVGVDLDSEGTPTHYVLVTGKQGSEYTIVDPGDHTNTTLDISDFVTRGHIVDPPGDMSGLDFCVGTSANLLVTDPSSNRTGFDETASAVLEQIPQSVYFSDSLRDDEMGAPPNDQSHSVLVFQPAQGTYTVFVTGRQLGSYTVQVDAFSADGTAQPEVSFQGVANVVSSSTFQVQFASTTGASPIVTRVATFQSTIADLSNSFQLGLIDNSGIAKSLSRKISAAASAAARGESTTASNILGAFKAEVSAQTGKHITGIAPQMLEEDASSIIGHLP